MKNLLLTLAAVALASPALQAGTVAHFRFDNDPSATVAKDETGVNNGTIIGGTHSASVGQNPVKQTGAANAQSLSLSGAAPPNSQYVTVPNNPSLSFGASAWTIEAYINVNTLPGPTSPGEYIAQKKDLASDNFADYAFLVGGVRGGVVGGFGKAGPVTGHELVVELGNGTTGWAAITSNLEIPAAGEWVFVSAAYNGSNSLRFTVDANLNDNLPGLVDTIALPSIVNVTNNGNLYLGTKINAAGASAQQFGGLIDEIRISNEVLPLGSLLSVPEPSSLALAAVAACGCFFAARRRKAA